MYSFFLVYIAYIHVFTSPLSWYKVEICSTDDVHEKMTIDDVKIKIYLILKIAFSYCIFALKS